jgi:hypothetical protein
VEVITYCALTTDKEFGVAREPDKSLDTWWKSLLWGIVVLAGGLFVFWYLDQKERAGESFRMQWIFVLVYDLLGKWGVLSVFAAIAAGLVVRSIIQRRRPPEAPTPLAAASLPPQSPLGPPPTGPNGSTS